MPTVIQPSNPLREIETQNTIPPLQNGDRLSREEFERRYTAMSHVKKAELIEGKVYMPSPVSAEQHGEPHFNFNGVLFLYQVQTPGVAGGDNSTVRLDWDNEPQPDGYLRILQECGGQSRVNDGYIEGAPELILEIAASTASYDLHDKLNAYRRSGVKEYIVYRVRDNAIDWFVGREGQFELLTPNDEGVIQSQTFPGLWLDIPAAVAGDFSKVMNVLNEGIAHQSHQQFVTALKQASVVKQDKQGERGA